ncbi:hypothetical protein N7526_008936 [Penicillium atrosanguineum]|nr:hypothetical protein N7526_008936 [Penicillium atrosanguineum]
MAVDTSLFRALGHGICLRFRECTSGYTTSGTGLSSEESLHLTRLVAHYPASVRHRRRSISGPHARAAGLGERG